MGHSSLLAIAVQVNAERHNKWLAGCVIRRVRIQWDNSVHGSEDKQEENSQNEGQRIGETVIPYRNVPFPCDSHMSMVSQVGL